MKSILMSIRPKWVEKIASGEKTVEVRKSVPKFGVPFKCYIYETRDGGHSCKRCKETSETCYSWAKSGVGCYNGRGKVVGEFVCDWIYKTIMFDEQANMYLWGNDFVRQETCLSSSEMNNYGKGKPVYGLNISNLKIYDKPRELSEFNKVCKMPKEVQCDDCPYYDWNSIRNTCFARKLTRPPQSWCYAEEV